MGEVIARIKNRNLPKALQKDFSEVIHVKETSRIAIYGIKKANFKKQLLKRQTLLEHYGKSQTEKQKPAKAVWRGLDGPVEVTVVGAFDSAAADNYPLMKVRESGAGIPYSELEWSETHGGTNGPAENDGFDKSPVIVKLREENSGLKAKNRELADRNQELEAQLKVYKSGDIRIIPTPVPQIGDSRFKSALNRTTGWVGRKLPGSRPSYESGALVDYNGTPAMVVEEEWRDGYSSYERRRGAAAVIGAAALVGVAVLAAGLWGEHEEQEAQTPKAYTTVIHKTVIKENENPLLKAENNNLKHLLRLKNLRIRSLEREEKGGGNHAQRAIGEDFYVEPGNGITNEIQDYARAHGYQEVSGGQAWMLYENMRESFGLNLVELPGGGDDTYIRQQGDVGISRPGEAKWPEQVEKFLQNRLSR